MFCPNCTYEYEKGVKTCPDCGAELVEKLPEEPEPEDLEELETAVLCDVENEIEADVLRGMLEEQGVYSYMKSNLLPSSRLNLFFFKEKGIGTVIVNKEDLPKAKAVLKDFEKSSRSPKAHSLYIEYGFVM